MLPSRCRCAAPLPLLPLPAAAAAAAAARCPLRCYREPPTARWHVVLAVSCSRGADVGHERARLLVVYFGTAISPGRPAVLDPAPSAYTALGALSRGARRFV